MNTRKSTALVYMGDFETTVYEGQEFTEVWASALSRFGEHETHVHHSIDETYKFITSLKKNVIIYYHNLKFDGMFWLSFLIEKLGFEQAYDVEEIDEEHHNYSWQKNTYMKNKTVKYLISSLGEWYTITFKVNNKYVELRDSYKLLPFSVERIGIAFKTKHQKTKIEYKGVRYAGCEITDEEKEYIINDVEVVREALEFMFNEGHNKLTIGACCMDEFKKRIGGKSLYDKYMPDISEEPLDEALYGAKTVDRYIRNSYRGGWCYLCRGKENKIYHNGTTADVNSLYPSVMHSRSGCMYPTGMPTFWKGDIPDLAKDGMHYYFVRFRCEFYLKKDKLPFVQIKTTLRYKGNEMLETSDMRLKDGRYTNRIKTIDGKIESTAVTLTMTMTDYKLFLEHYHVVNMKVLDGCYFQGVIGLFDDYINKYKEIKMKSTGAMRELAKLFLNSLYGKTAASTNSSFKVGYITPDSTLAFFEQIADEKKAGYIPVGSAITSYARCFTIRAAQANYHGVDKPGFIYADTDSIHCDLPPDKIKGIKVHDTDFCCWKLETCWDFGLFVRQKTYLEYVNAENLKPCEPYYNIRCAGMPEKCKKLFIANITGDYTQEYYDSLTDEEKEFIAVKRDVTDYKVGLCIPGKLMPRKIKGGVILVDTTYEMR